MIFKHAQVDTNLLSIKIDSYDCGHGVLWLGSFGTVTTQHATRNAKHNATLSKGRFTRYDFVADDKLTTGLRHELFRVNQTYNSLNGPKSCRRPVVSLSYATKPYRINRP